MLKEKNASNHSSVDSLIGETPSKYAKMNKRVMPGDEDGFLSKIVQPMKAKTKNELLNQAGVSSRNQGTKKGIASLQTSDSKKPLGRTQATD